MNWFCLQAQTKREHVAAESLRRLGGVGVFLPRIRFQRRTVRGLVWFNEALFPGYCFAQFDFATQARVVQAANGVRGIVHFGDRWPVLSEASIAELRALAGPEEVRVIEQPLTPGEAVEIGAGAFRGWSAVVQRVVPARDRVRLLLEVLGRETQVELPAGDVLRGGDPRRRIVA